MLVARAVGQLAASRDCRLVVIGIAGGCSEVVCVWGVWGHDGSRRCWPEQGWPVGVPGGAGGVVATSRCLMGA